MAEDLNRHFSKKDILIIDFQQEKKKKAQLRYVLGNPGAEVLAPGTGYSGLILGQRTNIPCRRSSCVPQLEKVCIPVCML